MFASVGRWFAVQVSNLDCLSQNQESCQIGRTAICGRLSVQQGFGVTGHNLNNLDGLPLESNAERRILLPGLRVATRRQKGRPR